VGHHWEVDIATALRTLHLRSGASWDEVRAAHRREIRSSHPDITGGPATAASLVNQAFDRLATTFDHANASESRPADPDPTPPASQPLVDDPAELLLQLADAGHEIGEVVFVDLIAGLLEIVVGVDAGVGQLVVSVDDAGPDGVPVSFTLNALSRDTPPPIRDVVADLMARVRA